MGYSILKIQDVSMEVLEMNVLKFQSNDDMYERLKMIFNKISLLIKLFSPQHLAIESQFFGKNVQSMLKLGRAQGVAIAAAMQHGVEVQEYAPKKIKQSITGNGNADKEQVWKMLQQVLCLDEKPHYFDATDALAVALCHYYQMSSPLFSKIKKNQDWKSFILENKSRILNK
ncbi:MAG: crossover junction endodeoxyribonuclease RuvC [Bacteroidetes bacterium]|nr:crossover junction endodeoxyribonuclease RuvC [Bacteroidota bacterium]